MKILNLLGNTWVLRSLAWETSLWFYFYRAYLSLFKRDKLKNLVKKDTDIVVEGFPRSANTYLSTCLEEANKKELKLASHLHDIVQLYFGKKYSIPIFIVFRKPLESLISFKMKFPKSDLNTMSNIYIKFYSYAIENSDHINFIDFSDATTKTDIVVEKILSSLPSKSRSGKILKVDQRKVFSIIKEKKLGRAFNKRNHKESNFDLSIALPTSRKESERSSLENSIILELGSRMHELDKIYEKLCQKSIEF
tara:strand:- start:18269 stop:19021 length:753 start_codon:yes stop_codon:yes gene_type:complete